MVSIFSLLVFHLLLGQTSASQLEVPNAESQDDSNGNAYRKGMWETSLRDPKPVERDVSESIGRIRVVRGQEREHTSLV